MKRLLGGVRQKWAAVGTFKKVLSVAALLTVAAVGVANVPVRHVQAAPDPNNTPTSFTWLNRFYLVDNLGNNYFDSNTYDNKFEYQEQGDFPCKNNLKFTSTFGDGGDITNIAFFYDTTSPGSLSKTPSSSWDIKISIGEKVTNGSGQTPCVWADHDTTVNNNGDARRTTFYTNNNDQVISIPSGIVFSRKGDFGGSNRYFRDDEVSDQVNVCPDMIIKHPANVASNGELMFGKGDIPGSAMLFSVEKNSDLNDVSESYSWISGAQNVDTKTCHSKADAINKNKGGIYAIAGYGDNNYDGYFKSAGLDKNGASAANGDTDDDSFIIFIGGINNMPKDASGNPIQTPAGTANGEGDKNDENACKGGALGYFICPIIDGIQSAINLLRDAMQSFLTVNPLPIGSGPIYDSWNNIRNLSNIAFVIAFFAIIFSQATSVGISNYGIKRLLPRLIAIAIATNISYFLCSFLIDIFNILGVGITALFAAVNNGQAGAVTIDNTTGGIFAAGITAGLAWAITSGAIVEIFPLIVSAFIAFLITFILLVARQALIVLLIIVSPIAFVAGLLPGTQSWFKRWFDMFSTLLLMYPLIMALFAAARLATSILSAAASG